MLWKNFCSGFSPWVVNQSFRDLWILFDLFRVPFSPLLLRYAQVEHLTSVNLPCWTLPVDRFHIEGIWILVFACNLEQVWFVIVLNLVTTFGMIA